MDYNNLILSSFWMAAKSYWWLILILALLPIAKTAWFKGKLGEALVQIQLNIFLDKGKYRLIHNVTLPTEGGTTQIDHIVVSQFGLFVIETKYMKGWIFGSEKQSEWTQKIYHYTHQFQNPLRQNYKHVKTLESILGLPGDIIYSVIVFVGDSTFKTKMPDNVTFARGCTDYIRQKTKPVLTGDQVDLIVRAIEGSLLTRCYQTNKKHIEYVNSIIEKKKSNS